MALIFNNLIINKNSKQFQPFLFNLVSGRLRLLNDDEFAIVCSILKKQDTGKLNSNEKAFFDKLITEKQFFTDDKRSIIESKMIESGYFNIEHKCVDTVNFMVEVTRNCNMYCEFCYVKSHLNDGKFLTKKHIDAIHSFFCKYLDDAGKIEELSTIKITGGEPLLNDDTINIINYIALNGMGKSTLINLIVGMYADEYLGGIFYDGVDIRDIDMTQARRDILGFVEQEPLLLSGVMSGGEKQSASITKMLTKNPKVMIFDEPTSALDVKATEDFAFKLNEIKRDKIILIITHDDAVKNWCDGVVVIEQKALKPVWLKDF